MIALKPRPFVQSFFDMQASRQLHMFVFFSFCSLGDAAFPSLFCTIAVFSLFLEYVARFSLQDGVFFPPCDHGLDFLHELICEK